MLPPDLESSSYPWSSEDETRFGRWRQRAAACLTRNRLIILASFLILLIGIGIIYITHHAKCRLLSLSRSSMDCGNGMDQKIPQNLEERFDGANCWDLLEQDEKPWERLIAVGNSTSAASTKATVDLPIAKLARTVDQPSTMLEEATVDPPIAKLARTLDQPSTMLEEAQISKLMEFGLRVANGFRSFKNYEKKQFGLLFIYLLEDWKIGDNLIGNFSGSETFQNIFADFCSSFSTKYQVIPDVERTKEFVRKYLLSLRGKSTFAEVVEIAGNFKGVNNSEKDGLIELGRSLVKMWCRSRGTTPFEGVQYLVLITGNEKDKIANFLRELDGHTWQRAATWGDLEKTDWQSYVSKAKRAWTPAANTELKATKTKVLAACMSISHSRGLPIVIAKNFVLKFLTLKRWPSHQTWYSASPSYAYAKGIVRECLLKN